MHYIEKIKNQINKKTTLSYYNSTPINLYECNLEYLYKNDDFFKQKKLHSPCFVRTCRSKYLGILKEYAIIISDDENYKKISEKAKKLIIYHELGHIINQTNGHLSEEDIADEYAIKLIGKINKHEAKQLAEWISMYKGYDYNNSYLEFKNRFVY